MQSDVKYKRRDLFGVQFANVTLDEVVQFVAEQTTGDGCSVVHTVNVDHLCLRFSDAEFARAMDDADMVIPDGMPIVWFSKLIGRSLKQRVTGVDLSYEICAQSVNKGFRIYMLGAAPGVLNKAVKNLKTLYPGVHIVGAYSPTRQEVIDLELSKKIISKITESKANVLLVALGAPLQEVWIYRAKPQLRGVVAIGVGATFDFMAGKVSRAPKFIRNAGLEWLYRFLQEPRRLFKRYFIRDLLFLRLCVVELIKRIK
jgi:N-acetylglucosaminyldiphosphoundecaprenol N-acetyl-beta-D-mannosaminyltransferase